MDYLQSVGQGFGQHWRGILFRRTFPQLADVIAKTKKWFWQIFPGATYNKSGHVWTFPDGEELLLRSMTNPDDYWNYHGHEYPWIGFEELTTWPTLECYEAMKPCCRSSHPGMPRKYRATTNPYGVGHNAVKAYIVDHGQPGVVIREKGRWPRVRIRGHYSENTHLSAADPDYIQSLDSITNIEKRKAWRDGDWDIVAGGMFDDVWDAAKHYITPFKIPASWYIDRSFDWGSSHPFSVGWWAESDGSEVEMMDGTLRTFARGTLFRIAEWYGWNGETNTGCRMSSVDIARGIKTREAAMKLKVHPGPADSSIYDAGDGESIAKKMESEGIEWDRANKSPGTRKTGWELIRVRLSAKADEPGLFIFKNCEQWRRTIPTLSRSERDPEDIDINGEDHIADETRYRILASSRAAKRIRIVGV